jgi:hypothetical protein
MPTRQKLKPKIPVYQQIDRGIELPQTKPHISFFPEEDNLSFEQAVELAKRLEYFWRMDEKNKSVPDYIDYFQYDAVIEMVALAIKGKNMQLLAGTGTGKTYMMFFVLDILCYYNYLEQLMSKEGRFYPFPIVMFVPASVVEQSNTVKKDFNNCTARCIVINYETLRTKTGLGNVFIKWEARVVREEVEVEEDELENPIVNKTEADIDLIPNWILETAPAIVLWDENQKLRNRGSLQTKLAISFLDLKHARHILSISASATPFVRPCESRFVTLSLSPLMELKDEYITGKTKRYVTNEKLSNENRIVQDLKEVKLDYIPRVHAENFKFWIKQVICGPRISPTSYSPAAMERLRSYLAAEHQLVHVHDVRFKHKTFNKHILIDFYDDNERKVYNKSYEDYVNSLLSINKNEPGGMAAMFVAILKFRQAAELLRARHLARIAFEQMQKGKSVIVATAFTETQDAILTYFLEEFKVPAELISKIRGGQSKKSRWENIQRFQDDKAQIMLLMLQAGGVGLSLHNYKPRNKRPRFVLMPPVWSITEMLQILGRAHRINSSSTTVQWVVWYRGTIEEEVYNRLNEKALSMRELMNKKEQWSDLFVDSSNRKHVNLKEVYEEGTSRIINETVEEDDEEKKDVFNLDEEMVAENMAEDENDLVEQE